MSGDAEESRTKHTAGPWRIGQYDNILTASGEILHLNGGVSIAMAGWEDRREEFAANAQLIASAPSLSERVDELGKALKEMMLGAYSGGGPMPIVCNYCGYEESQHNSVCRVDGAESALRKAGLL